MNTPSPQPTSAGDQIPGTCKVIEVHVGELKQLFNAIDPSPFNAKDLDPSAEAFIVEWGKELPRDASLALLVHLDRPAGRPDEAAILGEAIHEFFGRRAHHTRRRLRELFHRGRISLAIATAFLASCVAIGNLAATRLDGSGVEAIVREGLLIGGWVAMWRPFQIFLYDWWPIRAEARLFDRLAAMPVRITYVPVAEPDAWRRDWPAEPAAARVK
jgi:hypothetical protein